MLFRMFEGSAGVREARAFLESLNVDGSVCSYGRSYVHVLVLTPQERAVVASRAAGCGRMDWGREVWCREFWSTFGSFLDGWARKRALGGKSVDWKAVEALELGQWIRAAQRRAEIEAGKL